MSFAWTAGQLKVTPTYGAVPATAKYSGKLAFTATGDSLYVRPWDGRVLSSASTRYEGGRALTDDGALWVRSDAIGSTALSYQGGPAMDSQGVTFVSNAAATNFTKMPLGTVQPTGELTVDTAIVSASFAVNFTDAGAGVVNIVPSVGGVTGTFTRATIAWTKLSTGLWAPVASGSPRSAYLGATTAVGAYDGYLRESARTELVTPLTSKRDMTDAAWVKVTVTAAKTATGIDGVANSATRLTATGATSTILQTLVALGSSRTYSVWLRRVNGVGTINIVQGATTLDVTASLNTSTYTRVELNANVLNAAFGIQIITSGDVIEADFNQFEAGAFASSPIDVGGVTRNADVLTYPSTSFISRLQGTLFVDWRSFKLGTSGIVTLLDAIATGADAEFLYHDSSNALAQMASGGIAVGDITLATTVTNRNKQAMSWAVNNLNMANNGVLGTPDISCAVPVNNLITLIVGDTRLTTTFPYDGTIRSITGYLSSLHLDLQSMTI